MPRSIAKSVAVVAHARNKILAPQKPDKIGLFIKLDRDVVEWFKAGGAGYH